MASGWDWICKLLKVAQIARAPRDEKSAFTNWCPMKTFLRKLGVNTEAVRKYA